MPMVARELSPADGTENVDPSSILLTWRRAGREAASHNVYVSTDVNAVTDGTEELAVNVSDSSYAPELELGKTYFWRVDEVNDVEDPAVWAGGVQSFSTGNFLVVDDFESYNDMLAGEEGSNLVYLTWIDGYVEPPDVRVNGSTIGYITGASMETSQAYNAKRSVPLFYDNTVATYSEVTANLASLQADQDWTRHGIKALTLRFFGKPDNVLQQMYVKVNGSKVTYNGNAENLNQMKWQMWYIDLASIGVSLSDVTELSIGFEPIGASGGQGMVLLDSIRLYPYDRQLITPTEPSNANLVGYYPFDEGEGTVVNDVTGNGPQGTFVNSPTWVESMEGYGTALQFPGVGPRANVTLGTWTPSEKTGKLTLAFWMNWDGTGGYKGPIGKRSGWGADKVYWNVEMNSSGNVQFFSFVNRPNFGTNIPRIGTWHHFAWTFDGVLIRMYVDGVEVGEPQTGFSFGPNKDIPITIGAVQENGGNPFRGMLDEFRFYDDALSSTDIAWLSGRTKTFDKPF